jgi:hypothetical protein
MPPGLSKLLLAEPNVNDYESRHMYKLIETSALQRLVLYNGHVKAWTSSRFFSPTMTTLSVNICIISLTNILCTLGISDEAAGIIARNKIGIAFRTSVAVAPTGKTTPDRW